jgi:hypothetical protein
MRNGFLLSATLLLAALASAVLAQSLDIDVRTNTTPPTLMAENRRNPGRTSAIATGDFGGSGPLPVRRLSDVALGSPYAYDQTFGADSGQVYVWYGRVFTTGAPLTPLEQFLDLTVRNQDLTVPTNSYVADNPTQGFQIRPERGGERFGTNVAGGDFDGDGLDDLAISAPGFAFGPTTQGAVYLIYGSDLRGGLTDVATEIAAGNGFEVSGRGPGRGFGDSLLVRDVNDDGYDDLIIGSPNDGVGGIIDVIWGGYDMGVYGNRVAVDDLTLTSTIIQSTVLSERLGAGLHVGPIQFGTGARPHLFAGAPIYPDALTAAGRVIVYELTETGPNKTAGINPVKEFRGSIANVGLGSSIAVGNLIGPAGKLEIVIGAPQASAPGGANAGRVYIQSFTVHPNVYIDPVPLPNPNESLILYGAGPNYRFGTQVAIGEFDGNYRRELFVTAPRAVQTGIDPDSGILYVFSEGNLPNGPGFVTSGIAGPRFLRVLGFKDGLKIGQRIALARDFDGFEPGLNDVFLSGDGIQNFDPVCSNPDNAQEAICISAREGTRAYLIRGGVLDFETVAPTDVGGNWADLE